MGKKCIVCGEPAVYGIKDTSDYYCEECAKENFADLALLIRVEEIAQKLKKKLDEISVDAEGQVVVNKEQCQLEEDDSSEGYDASQTENLEQSDEDEPRQ